MVRLKRNSKFILTAALLVLLALCFTLFFAGCGALTEDKGALTEDVSALSDNGMHVTADYSASAFAVNSSVSVSTGGVAWSADKDSAPQIGAYSATYASNKWTPANISASISGLSSDIQVDVTGERFDTGEAVSDENITVSGSNITLTQAGLYTAKFTDGEGNTASYYAKIAKEQLSGYVLVYRTRDKNLEHGNYKVFGGTDVVYQDDTKGYRMFIYNENYNPASLDYISTLYSAMWENILTIESITAVDFENEIIDTSGIEQINNATFAATDLNAGRYTVKVKATDGNHEFASEAGSSATFTVNQKDLAVKLSQNFSVLDSSADGGRYVYSKDPANQRTPTFTASVSSIAVTTEITDSSGKIYVNQALPVNRELTLRVTGIAPSVEGDTTYRNYRLPSSAISQTFTVYPAPMAALSLESNTDKNISVSEGMAHVPYRGKSYSYMAPDNTINFENFISRWLNLSYKGHNGFEFKYEIGMLSITAPMISTVKRDANGNVEAYEVKVKPAANYEWESGGKQDEISFSIFVDPVSIADIDWERDANGNAFPDLVYNGQEQKIDDRYTLPRLFDGDVDVKLVLEYLPRYEEDEKDEQGNLTGNKKPVYDNVNAYQPGNGRLGDCIVLIKGLTGNDAGNYTLGDFEGLRHSYRISRRELPLPPSTAAIETITFDGELHTFVDIQQYLIKAGIKLVDKESTELIGIQVVNRTLPSAWTGLAADEKIDATLSCLTSKGDGKYDLAVTGAGVYSLEMIIYTGYQGNYCWQGDVDKVVWDNFVSVERITSQATAPSLPATRLSEDDVTTDISVDLKGNLTVNGKTYESAYEVTYGKYGSSQTSSSPMDLVNGKRIGGSYFARLTLKDAYRGSIYWKQSTDTATYVNNSYYQIELKYSVQVDSDKIHIEYVVENYVFGANGVGGSITKLGDAIKQTQNNVAEYVADTTLRFFVKNVDGSQGRELQQGDLVNGLPWNAGTYVVSVTITFTDPSYAEWNNAYDLTVSKRPVSISWTFGGDTKTQNASFTSEYNGNAQKATAAITNVAKRSASDSSAVTLTLNDIATNGVTAVHDDVYVMSVTGVSDENYTLDGAVNATCQFTITRRSVKVQATAVTSHAYGQAFANGELTYACIDGTSFLNGDGANVTVLVYKNGNYYTDGATLAVGEYTLVPVWNNDRPQSVTSQYTIDEGNYSITVNTAALNVVAQVIKITLKDGGSSDYGQDVNLYQPGVTYVLAETMTVDEFKELVELTATNAKGETASKGANAGEYTLSATSKSPNYAVQVSGSGKYVINRATITGVTVESNVNGIVYDGQNHNLFTVTNDSGLTVEVLYGTDGSNWTKYTDNTVKNACDLTYRIKVTAGDNYNELTLDSVNVKITKATLTVTPSLTVKYGEKSPVDVEALRDLTNSMYTVTGFVNASGDNLGNIGLTGRFTCSTNYVQGSSVGFYSLAFNAGTLASTNYTFEGKQGSLTVVPLELEATIPEVTTTYYDPYSSVTLTCEFKLPTSTYTGQTMTASDLGSVYSQIKPSLVKLTTSAYENNVTKNVGNYEINGVLADNSGNFTLKGGSAKGDHIITAANLTPETVNGFNGKYDGSAHALTAANGSYATTVDGSAVTVVYVASVSNLGDASGVDWSKAVSANPSFTDVTTQYVYYRVTAANHNAYYGMGVVQIEKADNGFEQEFTFLRASLYATESAAQAAWTYGKYDHAYNPKGYNNSTNETHVITEPRAKFAGSDSKFVITIYRNGVQQLSALTYNTVNALFDAMWSNALFNAGTYRVNVYMAATGNYSGLDKDYYFKVDQKQLTVTPVAKTLTYGESLTFDCDITGFVNNGKTTEDKTVLSAINSTNFFAVSKNGVEYQAGAARGAVGTYDFVAKTYTENQGNYVLEPESNPSAKLTVQKRAVTIKIDDKTAVYNSASVPQLTYSVKSGNFLSTDTNVITLHTDALTGSNGISTNNVNSYAIYATFNGTHGNNYTVNFSECSTSSTSGITQSGANNAGTYQITKATISGVTVVSNVNGIVYDGQNHNLFTVTNNSGLTVKVLYGTDGSNWIEYNNQTAQNVCNVTYKIKVTAGGNYNESALSDVTIVIVKATVIVTANNNTVTYGEDLNLAAQDFTATSATLSDVLIDELTKYKVTFTTNYNKNSPDSVAGSTWNVTPVYNGNENVTPVYNGNENVTVQCNNGTVTVAKRNINVTVNGYPVNSYAKCDYQGAQVKTQNALNEALLANTGSFLSVSAQTPLVNSDQLADLNVTLTLPQNAKDYFADGYAMHAESSAANYNVNFVNGDSAIFMIEKARLTLSLTAANYQVTYGDALPTYGYNVEGMVNGELFASVLAASSQTVTYSTKCGDKSYSAWESGVNETYVVEINELNGFANYVIASYGNAANLAVRPRQITAEAEKTTAAEKPTFEYLEDANLHGGAYGQPCAITLRYSDVKTTNSSVSANINGKYAPAVSIVYNTIASDGQTAGSAPTKAGDYVATVTLSVGSNYVFVEKNVDTNTITIAFSVTKKSISASQFVWDDDIVVFDPQNPDELQHNFIDGFNANLLEILDLEITKTFAIDSSCTMSYGDENTENTYYLKDNKLWVTAQGRAEYKLTLSLKSSAQDNYEITGLETGKSTVEAVFYVVGQDVTLTINSNGWQYTDFSVMSSDDKAKTLNAKVNDGVPLYGLKYAYARVKAGIDISSLLAAKHSDGYGGFDEREVSHLYDSLSDLNLSDRFSTGTFDVGYYVICVIYDTFEHLTGGDNKDVDIVHIEKFDIVEVTKKQISLSTTIESVTFNGRKQDATVTFDQTVNDVALSQIVTAQFDGKSVSSGGTISGTNAGTYNVLFTISDKDHYVWSSSAGAQGGVVTVAWTINKDTAANNAHDQLVITADATNEATYGQTVVIGGQNIKDGYSGAVSISYKTAGQTSYTNGLPTNAGTYDVKLTLSDGGKNYDDMFVVVSLTINPKTVYAVASGALTYGDDLSEGSFAYVMEGLLNGDKETKTGSLSYSYVESYSKVEVGGTYYVAIDTDKNGVVTGLSAGDNYVIKAKQGVLTVNARKVTVTISGASSQFGLAPDLSKVTISSADALANVELVKDVNVTVTTTANNLSGVGSYDITAVNANGNFDVTFTKGKYVITARELTVTLSTDGCGGVYGETITDIVVNTVHDSNGADLSGFATEQGYVITVTYSGASYDGTVCNGSKPSRAGQYSATVNGSGSDNFVIVNAPVSAFEISKKTLDESKLTIGACAYTGSAIEFTINDSAFTAAYGSGLYEVLAHEDYVSVATHKVPIGLTDDKNYKWTKSETASTTIDLVILRANIFAIPYGTLTYGESFDKAVFRFELVDKDGRPVDIQVTPDADLLTYLFAEEGEYNKDKLPAGAYALTMKKSNGFIAGLESDDYYIELAEDYGKTLIVNKKNIVIKVGDSTSVYTQDIVLSNDFDLVEGSNLVTGDTKSDITYAPALKDSSVNKNTDVGSYAVKATASSNNYNVTVREGTHVIEPIKVGIKISATDGIYNEKACEVNFLKIVATNVGSNEQAITEKLNFIIIYEGKSYDGKEENPVNKPTHAGQYEAIVTNIDSDNYVLDTSYVDGMRRVYINVAPKVLDMSKITIPSQKYNGAVKTPVIVDNTYNVGNVHVYSAIFDKYVDAGDYDIRISLLDMANYVWSNDATSATLKFTIEPADNNILSDKGLTIGNWTFGDDAALPTAVSLNGGKITYEYSTEKDSGYSSVIPTDAGTYYVRAVTEATTNYKSVTSSPVEFKIAKRVLETPKLVFVSQGDNQNQTYTGNVLETNIEGYNENTMRLSYDGMCRIKDGKATISALDAGEYEVALILADPSNYEWSNDALMLGGNVILKWTVGRQVVSKPTENSNTLIVNGKDIVYTPDGFNSSIMNIEGNVNAHGGSFTATVTLKDTNNYVWDDGTTKEVSINYSIIGINVMFIVVISVISGLCVGLALMGVILTLKFRHKRRVEEREIDERSRADGWTDDDDE